jgi:hypothetical protein
MASLPDLADDAVQTVMAQADAPLLREVTGKAHADGRRVQRWFVAAQTIAFFGFLAFATITQSGPYPELMWVCVAIFVLDLGLAALVGLRPDLSVKRSRKDYVDGAGAFFRELLSLWPLAAVAVDLWLVAKVFGWIVGAILSLPVWAMVGFGLAVIALIWITSARRR